MLKRNPEADVFDISKIYGECKINGFSHWSHHLRKRPHECQQDVVTRLRQDIDRQATKHPFEAVQAAPKHGIENSHCSR
jgi:hypothetical protein